MSNKIRTLALALTLAALSSQAARAQLVVSENFTDGTTTNAWIPFLGACLTAGSRTSSTGPSGDATPIPPCITATSPMTTTSYYSGQVIPGGHTSQMTGGNTGNLPDAVGYGALRLTNAYAAGTNNGFQEAGAIMSNFTYDVSNGLTVVFTTYTYEGNSGGGGSDGADGMSFFLLSGAQAPYDVGAFGGSLGYTCSNSNDDTKLHPDGIVRGFDGIRGGLIGLGIDEYGNFLNAGDNTNSGFGYQWGRIGLRGAGSITFGDLTASHPLHYPASLTTNYTCVGYLSCAAKAVQYTCETGYEWSFANPLAPVEASTAINDYPAVPGGYTVLSSAIKLANESATTRGAALPITYKLQIQAASTTSSVPLLSFWYSLNGGAWQTVLTNQNLYTASGLTAAQWTAATTTPTGANGVYFGFAGSSGGSNNVHEILCFQAAPASQSASSVSLNQKQTAQVQYGTQVYFASYNTQTYAGDLTANNLVANTTAGITTVSISSTANWDASCVLTGGACPATTATAGTAQAPSSRVMMTYNSASGTGVPFEWNNLSSAQTTALEQGDTPNCSSTTSAPCRLDFLRGDRTNEVQGTGANLYRDRPSVLGDIVDSSPTWVGAPSASFPAVFSDLLTHSDTNAVNATDPLPENSTTGSYAAFATAQSGRLNVVYAGSNDGFMHGFEAGYYTGTAYSNTNNDGKEVMAYMPDFVSRDIHIAGADEAEISTDFANPQYGHNFYVDGTPGTGDLYYNGAWHSWLVSGIGAGGPAIYALDITNPSNFTEGSGVGGPATTVIGEWSTITKATDTASDVNSTGGPGYGTTNALGTPAAPTTTMICANDTTSSKCGLSLGNTYGIPQIRRFHSGQWGAVFGNGTGSSTGAAGVFVMLVTTNMSSSLPTISFYFLKTPGSAAGNGIDYAVPVDLDGDHVVDYVYAGDKLGNIWRFDLTSSNPANWAAASAPLFTTGGQPITTNLVAVSVPTAGSTANRLLIEFGTGSQTPFSVTAATSYATGQQDLYGVWDWNMGGWNAVSPTQYASLTTGTTVVPYTAYTICGPLSTTSGCTSSNINLTAQIINGTGVLPDGTNFRQVSQNPVCWISSTVCGTSAGSNTSYGWYLALPGTNEQIIYSPNFEVGAFVVNTTIPTVAGTSCVVTPTTGYTMAISPSTGGAFTDAFFGNAAGNFETANGLLPSGVQLNGTGTPTNVTAGTSSYLVTQNIGGSGTVVPINPAASSISKRLTWVEKR